MSPSRPRAADGGQSRDAAGGPEPAVLVVDDNEVIADTYAQFLDDDYDVRAVYGGEAALEALGPSTEAVLLDRRMPGLSGDDVLARIEERSLDCRVVMVTAVDPGVDIVDLPFDEYLVKPVGRDELVAVVEEMRRRSSYDDPFRRFLALASKKATLEAGADDAELADSEAYARIEARLAERRDSLGVDTETLERVLSGDAPDIDAGSESDPVRTE
ncbi:MAG: response regulator transcription factor [Halosimplex sp.]